MPFVKLDTGILNSTIWVEKGQRDVFITALLLAHPMEIEQAIEQIEVRSLERTGFKVPPGWYGFVPAASVGIIRHAMVSLDDGLESLEKLGRPDPESRSKAFEGRRMIRVDGGFLILNYMKYRDMDHGAADRMRRLRERRKQVLQGSDKPLQDVTVTPSPLPRNVTQAYTDSREQMHTKSKALAQRKALSDAEMVYRAYPRKVGKKDALNAIKNALLRLQKGEGPDGTNNDEALAWLISRTSLFALSPAGQNGKYTPHPATWYNAARYLDDESEWSKVNKADSQMDAFLRRNGALDDRKVTNG